MEAEAGGEATCFAAGLGEMSAVVNMWVKAAAGGKPPCRIVELGGTSAVGSESVGVAAGGETPSHAVELGYKPAVGNGPVEAWRGAKSAEGSPFAGAVVGRGPSGSLAGLGAASASRHQAGGSGGRW